MTRRPTLLAALGLAMLLAAPSSAAPPSAAPSSTAPSGTRSVGFDHLTLTAPGGAPLTASVWFPTTAPAHALTIGPTTMQVAPDAPIAGTGLPLVLISHGNGGSSLSHVDTAMALAAAGFVVAAVTHAGDNYADQSRRMQLQDRPPQVTALLDTLLLRWRFHDHLAADRIGLFGFSAGGFTALVLIGGTPDLARVGPYCADHAQTFVCTVVRHDSHGGTLPATPPGAWAADPRIKAAVVAAPALGFSFTRDSLAAIAVPVQLWSAGEDQTLPDEDNVDRVHAALPPATSFHRVPGAGHFDFLAPCSPALARMAPPICTESHGFDRAAFHQDFNARVVAFFDQTLPPH